MQGLQQRLTGKLFLLVGLILVTLAVNFEVITRNLMFVEQPLMYVANSGITSLSALWQQFAHPQFLHLSIPFFRPAGHYLLYYLLIPLFGWHNQEALLAVNFLFLAGSGWLMTRIYMRLFPGQFLGGYIAFAIYLMHPALMLSRLSIMHFEYAHVFCLLAAWYGFIRFTENNREALRFRSAGWLILSLSFFALGTTFKEVTVVLGPVLCLYYYAAQTSPSLRQLLLHRDTRTLLILITLLTCTLFFYITWPWQSFFHNPLQGNLDRLSPWVTFYRLTTQLLGYSVSTFEDMGYPRDISNPWPASLILTLGGMAATFCLITAKGYTRAAYQQLIFLALASGIFLLLPILWGMANPWHIHVTVVFFSLLVGSSLETLLRANLPSSRFLAIGWLLTLVIVLISPLTNHANLNLVAEQKGFEITVAKNAIYHPPVAKANIHPNNIILVADTQIHNPYLLGDSNYPFFIRYDQVFNQMRQIEKHIFLREKPYYNGTLFPYAYLMPGLREEEYPFSLDAMEKVPNEVLYTWLQNQKDILCFGYDNQGQWHDQTALFQQRLQAEQTRRHLTAHAYHEISNQYWLAAPLVKLVTPIEDPALCEYHCDQRRDCRGFVMLNTNYDKKIKSKCLLMGNVEQALVPCQGCQSYLQKRA